MSDRFETWIDVMENKNVLTAIKTARTLKYTK
jgi:hypothetical protein